MFRFFKILVKKNKSFEAAIEFLPVMLKWLRIPLEELHFSSSEKMKVEVALEEALVNIIQYAYPDKKGTIDITYEIHEDKGLTITIIDTGSPFNPLDKASSVVQYLPLEERKIGGAGISLIINIMDKVSYKREKNKNVLTLIKHCHHDQ